MNVEEIVTSSYGKFDEINKQVSLFLEDKSVPDMRNLQKQFEKNCKLSDEQVFTVIKNGYQYEDYKVRFLYVLILGGIAHKKDEYLSFLKTEFPKDENWRVEEAVAKAFDLYCSKIGYENCLPAIHNWMSDSNENVRRASSEGLRVWTAKKIFKENPQLAIDTLGNLRADTSSYVKKSVANCLSDISKKYPELILKTFSSWDLSNPDTKWIVNRACRHLKETNGEEVQKLLGI